MKALIGLDLVELSTNGNPKISFEIKNGVRINK